MTNPHLQPSSRWILPIALGLITVIYALFSYWTPFQFDDMLFLGGYLEYSGRDSAFDWNPFFNMCMEIRNFDNGRLANILDLLVVLCVPKWIFAAITGIVTAGMFYFLSVIIADLPVWQRKPDRLFLLSVTWALSMIALPWRNNILVPDYSLNYLYASFFNLWFIRLVSASEESRPRSLSLAFGCLIALTAGAFHEGFSVAVGLGLVTYAATRRLRLSSSWWALSISYSIGTLFVITAPGIWLRAGRELGALSQGTAMQTLFFVTPLALIAFITLITMILVPSLRQRFAALISSQAYMISAIAMTASWIMCFIVDPKPRNGWWPELLAIIVFLTPCISYMPLKWVQSRWLKWSSMVLFVLTCLFMSNVIKWQHFFDRQHSQIMSLMQQSPTGTTYFDIFPPEHLPKSVLFQPVRSTWVHGVQLYWVNNLQKGRLLALVPTALKGMRMDDAVAIDGTPGMYTYHGILIDTGISHSPEDYNMIGENGHRNITRPMTIVTSDGEIYDVLTESHRFVTDEGDTLFYVRPPLPDLDKQIISATWHEL